MSSEYLLVAGLIGIAIAVGAFSLGGEIESGLHHATHTLASINADPHPGLCGIESTCPKVRTHEPR